MNYPIPTEPTVVTVTPDMAVAWLELNKGNRHLSLMLVRRYAKAMKAGRWHLTHQGIAFDQAGLLMDGQHRLRAVVDAGVPAQFLVIPGCDRNTFAVVDTGRKRAASQLIDHPHRNAVSAAARAIIAITTARGPLTTGSFSIRPENDQILDAVDDWPELVGHAGTVVACYRVSKVTASVHLAVIAQVARTQHAGLVDRWLSGLSDGSGLDRSDPRLHLRNRFLRDSGGRWTATDAQRAFAYGLIVTAWNYWATGRPMGVLKVARVGDQLPEIVS